MRRVLYLLCILLLLTAAAYADTVEDIAIPADCVAADLLLSGESAMNDQTVIDRTLMALMAHHPEDETLMSLQYLTHASRVTLTDGRSAWVGSIFTQQDETPIEAVLTLDDATGAVLRYEENNTGWFRDTQAQWERVYGRYGAWPLNTQVLFDVLYCLEVTHAVPPEGCVPEAEAYEIALDAAGLTGSRDTLHCERTLIYDMYAPEAAAQYVWMITICLDQQELAQINLSAVDGHVMNVFDYREDVG